MTASPDTDEAHPPLATDDAIFRRFLPGQWVHDSNLGRKRLSSAAFERRKDENHASCYVESIMAANGLSAERVLDDHEGLGNARVEVETLHHHGYGARPDPDGVDPDKPHSCDVAHGAILEPELGPSALKKRAGKLAKDDRIVVLQEPAED